MNIHLSLTNTNRISKLLFIVVVFSFFSCENEKKQSEKKTIERVNPADMVWVEKKRYLQGAKVNDPYAMNREKPSHHVTVDGFYIDATEVTNKQFEAFVNATNYITVAERPIDWEDLKKDLPPGTAKPHDSVLKPGSLIFNKNVEGVVNMGNFGNWWTWKIGANWRHPQGPKSSIEGKEQYPVVHIAYEDAMAYCKWANRELPTEAQWEAAAQGTNNNTIFTWGNDPKLINQKANTWQGVFPTTNNPLDGYKYISPVKSFPPNSIGIYDMAGNVWEMTSDNYDIDYYKTLAGKSNLLNPKGAKKSYNPDNPYIQEKIIKGGSFLCNASYCASYRISAKMGMSPDSGSDHIGFRTVLQK
ncbi:formylglycine-generating enzyme family protein [Flavobacteriaceae bacterium]|nr:formylglycine-generating enzyme family protein [Flavobacteriaceae bacterium]MDB9941581.1 formylglycine-generating enzyme family protein [Flavobacteriaceae bacterium]